MVIEKTKSGRTKNVSCPHCDQKFYSKHTLNMHIKFKHSGDKPLQEQARAASEVTAKAAVMKEPKQKPFKKEAPPQKPISNDWDPY